MLLQSVFYNNPDYYPPMINAAYVFDKHQVAQSIICTDFISNVWKQPPIDYPSSTRIISIPRNRKSSLLNYLSFCWQVLRQTDRSAEWIIAYDMHAFLPARLAAWLLRKRLAYHSHDYAENSAKVSLNAFWIKRFERWFARTAELVIVPDRERAEVMKRELKLKSLPLIAANSSLAVPEGGNDLLHSALSKLGKQFDKIVFRPGRIGRGHCLDITIRSLPFWANDNWGFVIMGPGEEVDKQWLQQVAEEVGAADRFVILPAVSYTKVLEYASGATLGHGLYEPIHINNRYITTASNKIMEYIAAGLPLLLSESAGNSALVQKYGNGLVVPYNDSEAIAAAINQILGDEALAETMADGSRRAFREEFNYECQLLPVIERLKALTREQ